MIETAKQNKIKYQILPLPKRTFTDLDHIVKETGGIPGVCVYIPCNGYHNPISIIDQRDLYSTINLVEKVCLNINKIENLIPRY